MDCRICGRQFDPLGFQVMVPGLPHGFDRVDCALEASALNPPEPRAVEPLPAPVRALPTPVAFVPALAMGPSPFMRSESVRPQLLAGANLALLAAGTAATIYLWLRVFGADAGPFSSLAERASQAFGRTSVAAAIDLTPETQVLPEQDNTNRGAAAVSTAIAVSVTSGAEGRDRARGSDQSPGKEPRTRRPGGPVARPSPPAPAPTPQPPAEPGPTRSAPAPTFPVPSSPPDDRVPGPTLPGGSSPEQPVLPGGGRP